MTTARPADVLLRGGTVVTVDDTRRIIEDGVVAVTDGLISEIATRGDEITSAATEVIDTAG